MIDSTDPALSGQSRDREWLGERSSLLHTARAFCSLACSQDSGAHDDDCHWFGTVTPVQPEFFRARGRKHP